MTREQILKLWPNASESTIRANLDLGAGQDPKPQPHPLPALDQKSQVQRGSSLGLVVSLVCFRSKLVDFDNLVAGCKPLRDAVAATLGLDDADPRLEWEYHQIKTTGPNGVLVKVAPL